VVQLARGGGLGGSSGWDALRLDLDLDLDRSRQRKHVADTLLPRSADALAKKEDRGSVFCRSSNTY
jgi:hypothetical protein